MSEPRRGWTVFCAEDPAEEIEAMPPELHDTVVRFLSDLAVRAGAAIDAGEPPPGHPMDDVGIRYSIMVARVIIEYVVVADIRELRVPSLVWIH